MKLKKYFIIFLISKIIELKIYVSLSFLVRFYYQNIFKFALFIKIKRHSEFFLYDFVFILLNIKFFILVKKVQKIYKFIINKIYLFYNIILFKNITIDRKKIKNLLNHFEMGKIFENTHFFLFKKTLLHQQPNLNMLLHTLIYLNAIIKL